MYVVVGSNYRTFRFPLAEYMSDEGCLRCEAEISEADDVVVMLREVKDLCWRLRRFGPWQARTEAVAD